MEFIDRILSCMDCGSDFIFTAGEQLFFFDKQFRNDPKRCKICKSKRATASGIGQRNKPVRSETSATCAGCGKQTTVPFKPVQGRPVLCRLCYRQQGDPIAMQPGA